jgi:protein phosphatase
MAKTAGRDKPADFQIPRGEESGVRISSDFGLVGEPAAARKPVRVDVQGRTDQGRVRSNNEDQFLIADLERTLVLQESSVFRGAEAVLSGPRQGHLLIVADGMGGYEGGEVASAVAVEALMRHALEKMPWFIKATPAAEHELAEGLRAALQDCHERVRAAARERGLDVRMGTTLTVAYVVWPRVYVLHAGDSRAYLYRSSGLYRLTRDHTMSQRLVEQNVMTEEQAARSRYQHVLLNTVGGQSERVQAELHQLELQRRDVLLLCTDGLTGELDDDQIAARLGRGGPVGRIADDLIHAANEHGGHDNVTVVIARF